MCAPELRLLALQPPCRHQHDAAIRHLHSRYCCHLPHSAQTSQARATLCKQRPLVDAPNQSHPSRHHSSATGPQHPTATAITPHPPSTTHPCMQPPEAVKPSQGVEYTYARKPAALDHERCDLAHIWELGGGEQLAGALTSADNVFLSFRQVRGVGRRASTGLYWLWQQQA